MGVTEFGPTEAAKQSSYVLEFESKLEKLTATISEIYSKSDLSIAMGGFEKNEHLARVKYQVAAQLTIVGRHLEQLKRADNDSWLTHKYELENCWEDLLRSVKNLVAWIS
jgi:hypothetical protein